MDIQQLLSATQGHTKTLASRNGSGEPAGQFSQALSQASRVGSQAEPQVLGYIRLGEATEGIDQASVTLGADELAAHLESLGLKLSEKQLQALLEQPVQSLENPVLESSAAVDEVRTALAETASRLNLLAQFSELEANPEALPVSLEELALLASQMKEASAAEGTRIDLPSAGDAAETTMMALQPLVQQLSGQTLAATSADTASTLNVPASSANPAQRLASMLESLAATQRGNANDGKAAQASAPLEWQNTPLLRPGSEPMTASVAAALTGNSSLPGSGPGANSTASSGSAGEGSLLPGAAPLASAPSATSPALATTATLSTPVNQQGWSQQLGQQLVQFAQRGGEQQIKMQLHPAELGPLSISLKMSEQGAQAHFVSAHAQVRQVLEQAIPHLREALAEQGISLGETSVGDQSGEQAQSFAEQHKLAQGSASAGNGGTVELENPPRPPSMANVALDGRVDLYA
ncbi:flagellar hook-length control protein FliK [Halomonas sp. Bachu 37]|uniref:flagellar hook-length control protein FliK n=1 Tax=Halomonas kashgarensis TaxID=3084920 RepID=UPI003216B672